MIFLNITGGADSNSKPTGVGFSTDRTGYKASESSAHHRLNNAWISGWTTISFNASRVEIKK